MTVALEQSYNLGTIFVQKLLGKVLFKQYVENFGFGKNNNYLTYRKASRIYQDIDENKKYIATLKI